MLIWGEYRMRKHIIVLFPAFVFCLAMVPAHANIASAGYVSSIVDALGVPELSQNLATHIANVENPHAVTAQQVGLGNVKNIDTTNADNLTTGMVNIARLPVGTATGTIASGGDARFDSLPAAKPAGTPPNGRVYVWFD